jgi:hypothetical protein
MRQTCSRFVTKILPSPTLPVFAASTTASTNGDLDLGFRKKINNIFGSAVEFRVASLAPEALYLAYRHALYADLAQGIADIIKTKGFYNSGNKLHSLGLQNGSGKWRMLATGPAYVYK